MTTSNAARAAVRTPGRGDRTGGGPQDRRRGTRRLGLLLLAGLAGCDGGVLPGPPLPDPPPLGRWRVAWLPSGGGGIEAAGVGTTWRLRIDHRGPARQLELVCETLRDGAPEASEVVLATPLLEIAQVDRGSHSTVVDVHASDSTHVNLLVTLLDLSQHLPGPENAYLQVKRWGRRDEGSAFCPDALIAVPAFSARGDHGSGPMSRSRGESVQDVEAEVLLSRWERWYKDPTKGPRIESRLVLRLR